MPALFAYGAVLAISLIIGFIFTIVGVFVGHIILFDSIFFSVISGIVCNKLWNIHPAFCLLITIALFAFLFWVQNTRVGFWIIGVLLSIVWALVFAFLAYLLTNQDMIWGCVIGGIGFAVMMGLHIKARG